MSKLAPKRAFGLALERGDEQIDCLQALGLYSSEMSVATKTSVCLLGIPEVTGLPDGVVFPVKGLQLISLIALAPAHRMHRREIASMLWDSTSDAAAFANLRQLLTRLRKILPEFEELLISTDRDIILGHNQTGVDLCAFANLELEMPNTIGVKSLLKFSAELLEGITETTEPFQYWLTNQRTSLRERFFALATAVLIELTRFGRAPKSELDQIATRMLSLEPEREATYRTIIEAYGRADFFEEAERCYRSMLNMLAREHGSQPMPETKAIVRRVFAGRPSDIVETGRVAPMLVQPRIALLAPQWLEPNPENTCILKALIEDVANELTRYKSFTALASHSSFQIVHDSGMPVDNSKLRADYTVSGFVKPSGSNDILSMRMVNCASGEIVWATEFPFETSELFRSFRMLSVRIASDLVAGLERDLMSHMQRTGSGSAYFHYLTGRDSLQKHGLPNIRRARKEFGEAIAADGGFAPAYACLAHSLHLEWFVTHDPDPYLLVEAKKYANACVARDPSCANGHWMRGVIALYQRDFDRILEHFDEAELLTPNCADMLIQHADALAHLDDENQAWAKFGKATDINPQPPDHYFTAGASIAFSRGDYASVLQCVDLLGDREPVLALLAATHALTGNLNEARTNAKLFAEIYPGKTVAELAALAPDRNQETNRRYAEGLRLAGMN